MTDARITYKEGRHKGKCFRCEKELTDETKARSVDGKKSIGKRLVCEECACKDEDKIKKS